LETIAASQAGSDVNGIAGKSPAATLQAGAFVLRLLL